MLSMLLLESMHEYARKHLGRAKKIGFRASLVGIDSVRWLRAFLLGAAKKNHRRVLERRLALHLSGRIDHPT